MWNREQYLRIQGAMISVPKIISVCLVWFNQFLYTLKVVVYVSRYVQCFLHSWILTNLLPALPGAPEG